MENETATAIGLSILSIIALILSVVAIGYIYTNQPQEIEFPDISGINANTFLIEGTQRDIVSLGGDINDLEQDIKDLDFDIDKDDLEDLEDYANDFKYIDDNKEDIDALEAWKATEPQKGDTGEPGVCNWEDDAYLVAFTNCVNNQTITGGLLDCVRLELGI